METVMRFFLTQDLTARAGMHFLDSDDVYLFATSSDFIATVDTLSFQVLELIASKKNSDDIRNILGLSEEEATNFFDCLEAEGLISRHEHDGTLHVQTSCPGSRPIEQVILVLTDKCNLSCSFCYRGSTPSCDNTMAEQDVFALIPIINALGLVELTLSGGEPLLVPYLEDFYTELKKYRFRVNLQTNLTLLDKWVPFFTAVGFPSSITTSCDVFSGDGHEYRRIKSNLQICVDLGIRVAVNMMVQPRAITKADFKRLFEELYALELPQISIGCPMPSNNFDKSCFLEGLEWASDVVRMKDQVTTQPDVTMKTSCVSNHHLVCGAGDYLCVIQNGLEVLPCAALPQYALPLHSPEEFSGLWSDEKTFAPFRNPAALLGNCVDCDRFLSCRGGCKARAYYVSGSLGSPDAWNCAIFGKSCDHLLFPE